VGKSFAQYFAAMMQVDMVCLGLYRAEILQAGENSQPYVMTNPSPDLLLRKGDSAFVLTCSVPQLRKAQRCEPAKGRVNPTLESYTSSKKEVFSSNSILQQVRGFQPRSQSMVMEPADMPPDIQALYRSNSFSHRMNAPLKAVYNTSLYDVKYPPSLKTQLSDVRSSSTDNENDVLSLGRLTSSSFRSASTHSSRTARHSAPMNLLTNKKYKSSSRSPMRIPVFPIRTCSEPSKAVLSKTSSEEMLHGKPQAEENENAPSEFFDDDHDNPFCSDSRAVSLEAVLLSPNTSPQRTFTPRRQHMMQRMKERVSHRQSNQRESAVNAVGTVTSIPLTYNDTEHLQGSVDKKESSDEEFEHLPRFKRISLDVAPFRRRLSNELSSIKAIVSPKSVSRVQSGKQVKFATAQSSLPTNIPKVRKSSSKDASSSKLGSRLKFSSTASAPVQPMDTNNKHIPDAASFPSLTADELHNIVLTAMSPLVEGINQMRGEFMQELLSVRRELDEIRKVSAAVRRRAGS